MRIIKHGNPNKIVFECPWCGCVFKACKGEYTVYSSQSGIKTWAVIECPDCKGIVEKYLSQSPSAY